jgi:hypothetical protein
MTGNLEANDLTAMKGADGLNFMQAAGAVGYAASQNTTEALHSAQNTITNADYFIELHIEQGVESYIECPSSPGRGTWLQAITRLEHGRGE